MAITPQLWPTHEEETQPQTGKWTRSSYPQPNESASITSIFTSPHFEQSYPTSQRARYRSQIQTQLHNSSTPHHHFPIANKAKTQQIPCIEQPKCKMAPSAITEEVTLVPERTKVGVAIASEPQVPEKHVHGGQGKTPLEAISQGPLVQPGENNVYLLLRCFCVVEFDLISFCGNSRYWSFVLFVDSLFRNKNS